MIYIREESTDETLVVPGIVGPTEDFEVDEENPFDSDPYGLAEPAKETKDVTESYVSKDPAIMKIFTEYFNMRDRMTRKIIMGLNEADSNSVLTSLTSKLYDHIVAKTADIDFGEIPGTKGDITKLSVYDQLLDCINVITSLLQEFKQDPEPVKVINDAIRNVAIRKDLFARAFRTNAELPIIMYNTAVLSIIDGVSYMIATCIEFVKEPNKDDFKAVLNKVAYSKAKNHMIYNTLRKLNKTFNDGTFDSAMEHVMTARSRMSEGAVVTGVAIGVAALVALIPILRELVYLLFFIRTKISDFCDLQADLLQINIQNLQMNSGNDEATSKIIEKQRKHMNRFRSIANKIAVSVKKAESDADKETTKTDQKLKLGSDPASEVADSGSALF